MFLTLLNSLVFTIILGAAKFVTAYAVCALHTKISVALAKSQAWSGMLGNFSKRRNASEAYLDKSIFPINLLKPETLVRINSNRGVIFGSPRLQKPDHGLILGWSQFFCIALKCLETIQTSFPKECLVAA